MKDEKNRIYILDWEVHEQSNNAPSRALRCNLYLTVEHYETEETDEDGYLIREAGWQPLFERLPSNGYRYDGRPEYSAISATPGVTPNALTIVTVQYNDKTKNIRIGDRFLWGQEYFEIVDVNRIGVSLDETFGCITLQAKKAAGGIQ